MIRVSYFEQKIQKYVTMLFLPEEGKVFALDLKTGKYYKSEITADTQQIVLDAMETVERYEFD